MSIGRHFLWGLMPVLLFACTAASPPPAVPPDVTAAPTIVPTTTPVPRTVISIQIDEIRVRHAGLRIPISSAWMIPVNAKGGIDSRLEYLEGTREIVIESGTPYTPTSRWFISINREDLQQDSFGVWFVLSHVGDGSIITTEELNGFLRGGAELVASGAVAIFLTVVTPPVPDEAVLAATAARAGGGIVSRFAGVGQRFIARLVPAAGQVSGNVAASITAEQVMALFNAAAAVDHLNYFGEAYVIFPASDDYYLNNQIVAVTTDGSLEIVFSIFETDNTDEVMARTLLPIGETPPCNDQLESQLFSGAAARVITPQANVFPSVYDQTIDFRLRRDDVVIALLPYCEPGESVLWWRVRTPQGELGWMPEGVGGRRFLERVP